jgi:hypothetical protein
MRHKTTLAALLAAAVLAGCGDSGEPAVGKCTNSDPDLGVQVVGIEVVDCDDDSATTRITREVQDGTACEEGRLTYDEKIFCTEPLQ